MNTAAGLRKMIVCTVLVGALAPKSRCQSPPPLYVISHTDSFSATVRADSMKRMLNLAALMPGLKLDLRYATRNNFTGKKLYPAAPATFMRLAAAKALAQVQAHLRQQGYSLKIFDAYRPHAATRLMWELVKDERYAANPAKGSNHNRGLAVDLTVIETATGKELDMGTGFDNFTDTAHHSFTQLPAAVLQNRLLLKSVMEQYGFRALETEWWHYSWPNNRNYEALDIPLKKMYKIAGKK
jgi:zinc D-Ala-D-Ala dipeptidase